MIGEFRKNTVQTALKEAYVAEADGSKTPGIVFALETFRIAQGIQSFGKFRLLFLLVAFVRVDAPETGVQCGRWSGGGGILRVCLRFAEPLAAGAENRREQALCRARSGAVEAGRGRLFAGSRPTGLEGG